MPQHHSYFSKPKHQNNLGGRGSAARTAMEGGGGGGAAREDGYLKVLKIEIFFGLDFEICIISLLVM
jgi:hypothetical protein